MGLPWIFGDKVGLGGDSLLLCTSVRNDTLVEWARVLANKGGGGVDKVVDIVDNLGSNVMTIWILDHPSSQVLRDLTGRNTCEYINPKPKGETG